MADIIQGLQDTGATTYPPPGSVGMSAPIVATPYGEAKTSDKQATLVPQILLQILDELRALRRVVCNATSQPFVDAEFQE